MRSSLRAELAGAQQQALRDRNRPLLSVLRSTNAAIANAEAVDVSSRPPAGAIETAVGLGSAEVPRRELTSAEVVQIVQREIDELVAAAALQSSLGRDDHADELRAGVAVLRELLARSHE